MSKCVYKKKYYLSIDFQKFPDIGKSSQGHGMQRKNVVRLYCQIKNRKGNIHEGLELLLYGIGIWITYV